MLGARWGLGGLYSRILRGREEALGGAKEAWDGAATSRLWRAPKIQRLQGDGSVVFADGSVESDVDEIVHCVGFDYDFPFLDDTLLRCKDRQCRPLYEHLVHRDEPTLYFLGIPHSVVPFPLMQIQSLLAARVLSGLAKLPDLADRAAAVDDYEASLKRPKDLHHLGDKQWAYCERLLDAANLDAADRAKWTTFVETNRQVYNHVGPKRPKFPGSPDTYRSLEYVVDHDAGTWTCLNEADVVAAAGAQQ